MRSALIVSILALAAFPASADPFRDYVIEAEAIEERLRDDPLPPCSAENAASLRIVELAVNSVEHIDRCVRVTGLIHGRMMVAASELLYASDRFANEDHVPGTANPFRVGVNAVEPEVRFDDGLYEVTVTGYAYDCLANAGRWGRASEARATLEGSIVVSSGHDVCAWHGSGAAIRPIEIRYGRRIHPTRLAGANERERLGSIWPIESISPVRPALERLAMSFLADLRSENVASLAQWRESERGAWIAALLSTGQNDPFQRLRLSEGPPQMEFFWRYRPAPYRPPNSPPIVPTDRWEQVAACFCLEHDCTERWPIAWFDVTPKRDHPYVCLWASAEWGEQGNVEVEHQTIARSELYRGPSPFMEPDSPAPN